MYKKKICRVENKCKKSVIQQLKGNIVKGQNSYRKIFKIKKAVIMRIFINTLNNFLQKMKSIQVIVSEWVNM